MHLLDNGVDVCRRGGLPSCKPVEEGSLSGGGSIQDDQTLATLR